ncbi:MAG TPA: multiheme c-type cytochrome [Myxococcaceae bacterium]|nr:multiheme c-type cytochrome [Myxococcaceae bacterium]
MNWLRGFWDSVRPRTRRGGFLAVAAIVIAAGTLSVVLFVGAAMAWNPYLEYTLNTDVNAKQWAALPLSYTSSKTCAQCHETEHARLISASHKDIGCQSCHGALLAHAEAGDKATSDQVAVRVPTDEVCVRCHATAVGRPAGVRQVVPGQHFVSQCLECHDPHTGIANRPPVVRHPQENLPPCLTCHGPEGFKARNQRHPAGSEDDKRCLACHAAGRGPGQGGAGDASPSPTATP